MIRSQPQPDSSGPGSRAAAPAYASRLAAVRDPATSISTAMSLVAGLFWRDLARIAEDGRLHPPLRRRAESLLAERATELTEGELVALARVAGRPLISRLCGSGSARIVTALLGNPRLLEDDVVALCRTASAGDVLAAVAACHRWRASRQVRLALARQRATPAADALRALDGLSGSDLQALSEDATVPTLIRIGAARRVGKTGTLTRAI